MSEVLQPLAVIGPLAEDSLAPHTPQGFPGENVNRLMTQLYDNLGRSTLFLYPLFAFNLLTATSALLVVEELPTTIPAENLMTVAFLSWIGFFVSGIGVSLADGKVNKTLAKYKGLFEEALIVGAPQLPQPNRPLGPLAKRAKREFERRYVSKLQGSEGMTSEVIYWGQSG